jgi:hypothetical protein
LLIGAVAGVTVFVTVSIAASVIVVIVVVVWLLLLLWPSSCCQHTNSTLWFPNQVTEEARTGKMTELALHLQSLEADKRNASFTLHGLTDYNGSGKSMPSLY